jgi:hypothetical protein
VHFPPSLTGPRRRHDLPTAESHRRAADSTPRYVTHHSDSSHTLPYSWRIRWEDYLHARSTRVARPWRRVDLRPRPYSDEEFLHRCYPIAPDVAMNFFLGTRRSSPDPDQGLSNGADQNSLRRHFSRFFLFLGVGAKRSGPRETNHALYRPRDACGPRLARFSWRSSPPAREQSWRAPRRDPRQGVRCSVGEGATDSERPTGRQLGKMWRTRVVEVRGPREGPA